MPAALHVIGMNAARRRKPRVGVRLLAVVRGTDDGGRRVERHGHTLELGGGGVYVALPHGVEPQRGFEIGNRVLVAIRFGSTRPPVDPAPLLAVRGTIVRLDARVDGTVGVAVELRRFRFV